MGNSGNRGLNSKENCDSCNITDVCYGGFIFKNAKDIDCHPSEFSRNIQAHVTQRNIVILLINEQREKLSSS